MDATPKENTNIVKKTAKKNANAIIKKHMFTSHYIVVIL